MDQRRTVKSNQILNNEKITVAFSKMLKSFISLYLKFYFFHASALLIKEVYAWEISLLGFSD